MRTAAEALEAPAKRSLALSLLLLGDRSITGYVAVAGFAAAGYRLQATGVAAADTAGGGGGAAGVAAAERGHGLPVGTEAIGAGRRCGKVVWVVGMCASWPGPRNPERKTKSKHKITTTNTSAHLPSIFSTGQHTGRPI